ncbi:hypothetical protein BV20DRAFT_1039373 [Pilatotrama ljubarskyi]|nr:hypothetical protein BV20DRAFT_1039373 [Pilatotrama ljubarskyi]
MNLMMPHVTVRRRRHCPPSRPTLLAASRQVLDSSSSPPIPITLQAYVDRVISAKLRDPVGRRDFALHADGGRVMEDLTFPLPIHTSKQPPVSPLQNPERALQDDIHIGNCWHIPSRTGQLGIILPVHVYPTHVTIDHIPIEIAADIGRAPRNMLLWGVVDGELNRARYLNFTSFEQLVPSAMGRRAPPVMGNNTYILLSSLEYDIYASSHIQTFQIDPRLIYSRMYFGIVVLEIVDNWGSTTTCLYRVRIHGDVADI